LFHKITLAETKDLGNGAILAVASTEDEDRGRDIVRQAGWELGNFSRHPVLLAGHNYHDVRARLGHWRDIRVDGDKLIGTAVYDLSAPHDEPKIAHHYAARGMAAYSVGFIPDREGMQRREGGGWEFTKQELLEISDVSVPANPSALQRDASDRFEELLERLAQSLERIAPEPDPAAALMAALSERLS
jgi:hypothetical protein